jgi:DNA primase
MLERLSLRALATDIEHDMTTVSAETDETALSRIMELTRELGRRREDLARREQELAETAKQIRQATTGARSSAPALWT